jgi:hypothetical protein
MGSIYTIVDDAFAFALRQKNVQLENLEIDGETDVPISSSPFMGPGGTNTSSMFSIVS